MRRIPIRSRRPAKGERVTKRVVKESRIGRFCYYIPPTQTPTLYGYRVAVVWENEDGYHWTGDESRGVRPYYWGATLAVAQERCVRANEKLDLSAKEAAIIVMRSMSVETRGEE